MYAGSSTLDWCYETGCRFGGVINGVVDPERGPNPVPGLLLAVAAAVVIGIRLLVGRLK